MMKKLGASLCEAIGLAVMAVLFTITLCVAAIPAPVRSWKGSGLEQAHAEGITVQLERLLLVRGPWIAAIALIAAAVASVLRSDARKLVSGLRLVAAGSALLFALWAYMDLPAHRLPHAWNSLFVASGATLVLTAFLVGGGKGGGSKAAGASGKDAK